MQTATRKGGALGISNRQRRSNWRLDLLTPVQWEQLVKGLIAESPPSAEARSLIPVLAAYPSRPLDPYLLESLIRSHEPGWKDVAGPAAEYLPQRLGVELDKSTKAKLEDWEDLRSRVSMIAWQKEVDRELLAREKERLAILWGALSADIYHQCKRAMDRQ